MFNGCGCQCSQTIGAQTVYSNRKTLCTCGVECRNAYPDDSEAREACMDDCDEEVDDCQEGCGPDLEDITQAAIDCSDNCQAEYNGCLSDCFHDQELCDLGCGGDPECLASCVALEFECRMDCDKPAAECGWGCGTTYLQDQQDATAESILCKAECCDEMEEHYKPCVAECENTFTVDMAAQVTIFRNCAASTIIGGTVTAPIFDDLSECNDQVERNLIIDDRAKCIYDCEVAAVDEAKVCGAGYSACRGTCEYSYDRAISECMEAGNDTDGSPCRVDALDDYGMCRINCCFAENGRDLLSIPTHVCYIAFLNCYREALEECSGLAEEAADICHAASNACLGGPSPECTALTGQCAEATALAEACGLDGLSECGDVQADCLADVPEETRKGWCGSCVDA